MKDIKSDKEQTLDSQVTEHSFVDAYERVSNLGEKFADMGNGSSFTMEKRIKMLKQMVAYFETREEYERCARLMVILRIFGIFHFDTSEYK